MNARKYCVTIVVALLLMAVNAYSQKKSIYQKGWIDFNKNGIKDIYEDPTQPIDKRVADLLSQMNVDEKTCQLATLYGYGRVLKDSLPTENWKNQIWKDGIANIDEQLNGVGKGYRTSYHLIYPFSNHAEAINTTQRWFVENTRLGIPVDFSNEGLFGLNHTKATPLPAGIGIGSTWNRQLVLQAGEIIGREAKALGYTNIYTPILDVVRDQRWGRTYECFAECPYIVTEMGTQMVLGIQAQGVASTLKHYAVYSVPKGARDGHCRTDAHVAPREMHTIHLDPFKKVIERAKPMGIMASYNDYDGVPVIASHYFLTQLLKEEYGFDGYLVSDSEAVEFVFYKHHVAGNYDEAVRQVLEAGLNVRTNFSPPSDFILPARKLISENKISMKTIDKLVAEVLKVKFRLGLFDAPYVADTKAADKIVGADKNLDFIMQMQLESFVLLKNENNTLPLDKNKLKKVLVTGPLADEVNFMESRYGPNGNDRITVLRGIREYLKDDAEVLYAKGCHTIDKTWPESELIPVPYTDEETKMQAEALRLAAQSDVIIAVLGEDDLTTGESKTRTSLDFPGHQQQFLEALYATGKPVVLVLINGQPLTINWADEYIPAILECWFPAFKGGEAIAQTLFGDYNPGGKLTVTFPKSVGQIQWNFPFKPGSHGHQYKGWSPNGSGYTRVDGSLYPFGYGLSYTTFEYKNLVVSPIKQNTMGEITVSVDVTNTGTRKGDEVVQLYVKDKVSSVIAYELVLRGFERVPLEPGETKTVRFVLKPEDFELLDINMKWTVEPGAFEIMIGASSEDIKLKQQIELTGW
jgi:beta-glucosidase